MKKVVGGIITVIGLILAVIKSIFDLEVYHEHKYIKST